MTRAASPAASGPLRSASWSPSASPVRQDGDPPQARHRDASAAGPQTATIVRPDVDGRVPVVLFLHGWGATRPRFYQPWLDHLARARATR